jgi:hypothetical protein
VNFGGITKLNVKSSAFNSQNIDSITGSIGRTLASIPVSSNQNGYIFYENFTNYKNICNNRSLNTINIEITDDFNNYINFNNADWSMTLQIDILHEVISDYDTIDDIYNKEKRLIK